MGWVFSLPTWLEKTLAGQEFWVNVAAGAVFWAFDVIIVLTLIPIILGWVEDRKWRAVRLDIVEAANELVNALTISVLNLQFFQKDGKELSQSSLDAFDRKFAVYGGSITPEMSQTLSSLSDACASFTEEMANIQDTACHIDADADQELKNTVCHRLDVGLSGLLIHANQIDQYITSLNAYASRKLHGPLSGLRDHEAQAYTYWLIDFFQTVFSVWNPGYPFKGTNGEDTFRPTRRPDPVPPIDGLFQAATQEVIDRVSLLKPGHVRKGWFRRRIKGGSSPNGLTEREVLRTIEKVRLLTPNLRMTPPPLKRADRDEPPEHRTEFEDSPESSVIEPSL